MNNISSKTIFLFAFFDEFAIIKEKLNLHLKSKKLKKFNITGYKWKNYYFVISGIGNINASKVISILLVLFKKPIIYNIGFAGSLKQKDTLGTIYQIQNCILNFFDLTSFNYKFGEIPGGLQKYSLNNLQNKKINSYLKLDYANLISTDGFILHKNELKNNLINNNYIVDMEGFAYAHVSYQLNFFNLILIKVITDIIPNNKFKPKSSINKFKIKLSQKKIWKIIEKLLKINNYEYQ